MGFDDGIGAFVDGGTVRDQVDFREYEFAVPVCNETDFSLAKEGPEDRTMQRCFDRIGFETLDGF